VQVHDARFLYQVRCHDDDQRQPFADAGKTVRTGHSVAAVSGHFFTTRTSVMIAGRSQSEGNLPVKASDKGGACPSSHTHPESEYLAENAHFHLSGLTGSWENFIEQ
jgi:hypothetical protein